MRPSDRSARRLLPLVAGCAVATLAGSVLLAPAAAAASSPSAVSPTVARPAVAPSAAVASAVDGVAPTPATLIEENVLLGTALQHRVVGVIAPLAAGTDDSAGPVPGTDPAAPGVPVPPVAPPAPVVPPALMGRGPISAASSDEVVAALQTRLRWAGIGVGVTGDYDQATRRAVTLWQAKRTLPTTGRADVRTVASLARATATDGAVHPRCQGSGVVICVDKTQKMLRYYRGGVLVKAFGINVGPEKGQKEYGRYSATRVGSFHIQRKARFHVSSGYGTPMPYAMHFDKGIAFHNSTYFAATGYANSSYGCVTAAKMSDSRWLFNHARVGTKVVVHA